MRKSLWCAALLGLSAGTASAQLDANYEGSDTLFNILNRADTGIVRQLEASGAIDVGDLVYIGTGSGNGETELESNFQELAPMSRFLDNAACTHASATDPGCWVIALDGLALAADNTEDTTCDVLRYSGALNVTDQNGDGLDCPGCSGNTYTISDWRDVLRIVYGGQHTHIAGSVCGAAFPARSPIAEKNCNSDVRRQLVSSWSNLFEGGCTDGECAQGLKHAWRRDDASGTTEVFLELLSLPAITATPFCNGPDAGTVANNTTADADPIRRTCETNEQICTGAAGGPNAGTNGLVLPIKSPVGADPYFGITQNCSATTFSVGAFGDVQVTDFPLPSACPNGAPLLGGTCKQPKREGTGTGPTGFDCMAHANNDPPGTVNAATFDARVYNLRPRQPNGLLVPTSNPALNAMRASPWYRVHQARVAAGSNISFCREPDASDQIGCLVNAAPCTIGFSGVGAVGDASTPDTYPTRKGLGLRSDNNTVNTFPTAAGIQAACSTRYTLTRNLYVCTLDDFANTGTQNTVQSGEYLAAQQELKDFFLTDEPGLDEAVIGAGFITAPFPPAFVACD
jgi:ABC-type phosphate transport system substrate-binding protein